MNGYREASGKPRPIGSITTNWSGPAHDIDFVEIGTRVPCGDLGTVDILAQGPGKFTNLDLNLTGDLTTAAKCYATSGGVGGRIRGTISPKPSGIGGNANGIDVYSIQEGPPGSPDALFVGGTITNSTFETIVEDAVLDADDVDGVTISGNLSGAIHVREDLTGTVLISGNLEGAINAGAHLTGTVTIAGDVTISGSIIADSDNDGVGAITGSVAVTGEFNGDICGTNIHPYDLSFLLGTISFGSLGPDYTICGQRPCADAGQLCIPSTPSGDDGVRKNRYISFAPTNADKIVAFKVTLPGGWDDATETRWVGEPFDASCEDENGTPNGNPCTNDYVAWIARDPVFRAWAEPVVHVGDCEIAPDRTYEIRATFDGADFSDPLIVGTTPAPGVGSWADVVGALENEQWSPYNGVVNFNDITAIIQGFQKLPQAPHLIWIDLAPIDVNAVINFADISMTVKGFQSVPYINTLLIAPENCAADNRAAPSGNSAVFTLVPDSEIVIAGDVLVHVYVESALGVSDASVYEVSLSVSGGTSGSLELQGVAIDTEYEGYADYIFASKTTLEAPHIQGARFASGIYDGTAGVSVTDAVYLTTFTYQPVDNAEGVFTFTVEGDGKSYLLDSTSAELLTETSSTTVVGYGIDCLNDAHCDDANDCTTDSCVDYACQYTNVSSGTSCDDGLYCTATDTCNSSGACKGSKSTPCPSGWTCDEVNDYCLPN